MRFQILTWIYLNIFLGSLLNLFFFQSYHSMFDLLEINLHLFLVFLSIRLSQSYVHSREISRLTRLD